ncbi:MAG: galactofuranose transport system substrate-binding protein [Frankiales bacterium]|jgi:ribose transport system substrate-binding protein|nr:galactofuranose transport system substrate-binding protein [Frankiales bacterium]
MTASRRALTGQALVVAVGLSMVATGCSSKSSTSGSGSTSSTAAATSAATSAAASATSGAPAATGSAAPAATSNGTAQVTASASAAAGGKCTATALGYPKVSIKGTKVGFSQSEPETAAFRIAESKSMKDEAAKQGAIYLHTDANSKTDQQVTDIKSLINQGAKLIIVAPITSDGLQPAFDAAKAAKVPVVTVDRLVNATACTDYMTFIGSNFVSQGKRAADAMIKATGGKGKVAILLGSSGNGVTTDRTSGFVDELKTAPGLTIVAKQTANFARTDGQTVTASLLQAHPDITAIYGENDEMGIGAHAAILAAGKKPGKDIKIISVDGTHDAVALMVKGEYNGVIESNPRFGPLAFKALADFESDTSVPAKIIIQDHEYTPANAKANLANAF